MRKKLEAMRVNLCFIQDESKKDSDEGKSEKNNSDEKSVNDEDKSEN